MGAVAGVTAGLQAANSVTSSYNQSVAQSMQADFQSQQFEENSKLADMQATDAIKRGDEAADQVVEKTNRMLGSQRVAAGGSGVDVNSGSAALIQDDTKTLGALDALTIKNNAWKTAWGYKFQATQSQGQAGFAQIAGQNASNNTLMTGGMQAIGQGGQAAYYFSGKGGSPGGGYTPSSGATNYTGGSWDSSLGTFTYD